MTGKEVCIDMKEIRLHGRGGQGVVKAAHVIVKSIVRDGGYAQFIPFFGVERKGSPVCGYLRIDDRDIRVKTQVYTPDILLVLDDSLLTDPQVFEGFKPEGTLILNTAKPVEELALPFIPHCLATVDATKICLDALDVNIPNTVMLGAFSRATGLVRMERLLPEIEDVFGEKNVALALEGSQKTRICTEG